MDHIQNLVLLMILLFDTMNIQYSYADINFNTSCTEAKAKIVGGMTLHFLFIFMKMHNIDHHYA